TTPSEPNGTTTGGGSNMDMPLPGSTDTPSADQVPDPTSTVDSANPSMNVPGVGDVTANPDGSVAVDPATGTPLSNTAADGATPADGATAANGATPSDAAATPGDTTTPSPDGVNASNVTNPPAADASADSFDSFLAQMQQATQDAFDSLMASLLGDDTPIGSTDEAKPTPDEGSSDGHAGVKR
ncbi:MAG TPA: hypothetical protein VMV18_14165, partial [bacterium]|nr:hypothetical protein [bacterium]